MKKTLLNLSVLASLVASAQTAVGIGAHDDFATETEYGTAEGGIFWFVDTDRADYVATRSAGKLTIAADKKTYDLNNDGEVGETEFAYSVFGVGFGDSNGEEVGGTPFYLNVSGGKSIEMMIENTTGTAVVLDMQLSDADGNKLDIKADTGTGTWNTKVKLGWSLTAETAATYTQDLTGAHTVNTNAPAAGWGCADATQCPKILNPSPFKFDKVTQILFFPNGGKAFTGNLVVSSFKIGTVNNTGVTGISDETIKSFKDETVTVYNMMGAVVTTGKISTLNLTSGFYILKSASKTQKVVIE